MTKQERRELYDQGYTYAQIAEMCGVSKQAIQQSLAPRRMVHRKTISRIIYPKIKRWMVENEMSVSELNRMLGMASNGQDHTHTCQFLEGKRFDKFRVDGVLRVTGMTYEEAFAT